MILKIHSYLKFRYVLYFFSFVAGWPCVFYLLGWLPHYQINYIVLLIVITAFAIYRMATCLPKTIAYLILIQIICWCIYSVIHIDISYYTRILLLMITFFMLGIQLRFVEINKFIRIYNLWLLLQIVCGTIGLFLVLGGILQPIYEFVEMDGRMGYFFGLFTTNTYMGGLVRNAGFYDEPGALAFWGIYALLLNKLFIKQTKIEWILALGLLSTLSVAYYIQLFLYLLLFYRKEAHKIIIAGILILITLKFISTYNEAMDKAIFSRIEYDSKSGTIKGDNRSDLMKKCWTIFLTAPVSGVGASNLVSVENGNKYGFVGANFFFTWASDGLIGVFITYLPLMYLFKLGKQKKIYKYASWILLVGYLQRPYDSTQLLYPLMTFTIVLGAYYDLFLSPKLEQNQKRIN